jgi:hypothetical protein
MDRRLSLVFFAQRGTGDDAGGELSGQWVWAGGYGRECLAMDHKQIGPGVRMCARDGGRRGGYDGAARRFVSVCGGVLFAVSAGGADWGDGGGVDEAYWVSVCAVGRKQSFFEKKDQKTFANGGGGDPLQVADRRFVQRKRIDNVFCFFFSKKKRFLL